MSTDRKYNRRHFLQDITLATGGLIVLGNVGFRIFKNTKTGVIKAIRVDFDKCTGCRTCETACSAFNHKVLIDGVEVFGIGNPAYSNIKVHHFNPDVDVPVTCALCPDAPCIEACPIKPDIITSRKALYRDENMTIKNDTERCIGCMQCAKACQNLRAGVIYPNSETHKPERMCTLCNGDPQCVKNCPYGALEYAEMEIDRGLNKLAPADIAKELMEKWYSINA